MIDDWVPRSASYDPPMPYLLTPLSSTRAAPLMFIDWDEHNVTIKKLRHKDMSYRPKDITNMWQSFRSVNLKDYFLKIIFNVKKVL